MGRLASISLPVALAFLTPACAVKPPQPPELRDSIVSPQWLRQQLNRDPARTIVIEASWAKAVDAKDYHAGHVPGAIHLNTDDFENGSPRWHLLPLPELQRVMGSHGITPESTVVVYGEQTIAAARVWWIMAYAGARDVRLLNGGVRAWIRAGLPVESAERKPAARPFSAPPRDWMLATGTYVRDQVQASTAAMVDVRSKAEFDGQVSGYSYLEAKGRIPGAQFADNADDSARIYQAEDGTLRDPEEIRRLWRKQGILNAEGQPVSGELIFYCGTGWRSSLAFLYAHAIGFRRIRNYSDGWSGWSTHYEAVPGHQGVTPGWRQTASGNPVE